MTTAVKQPVAGNAGSLSAAQVQALQFAMSSEPMTQLLGREWRHARARGWEIVDCQAVRVFPRGRGRFNIEYEVHLRSGELEKRQTLFGELVGRDAKTHYLEAVASLRKSRRAQLPREGAVDQLACLEPPGMVVRLTALDERLPGLRLVHQAREAAAELAPWLGGEGSHAPRLETEVLGHRLGKRSIVRFSSAAAAQPVNDTGTCSVIAKLYKARSPRGEQVFRTMQALWDAGFNDLSPVRIPRPHSWLADWNILLMEDVEGCILPNLSGDALEDGFRSAGRALAALHGCPVEVPDRYSATDEVALLTRWAEFVRNVFPHLGDEVRGALRSVSAELGACGNFTPALVHRDYYEKQVLLNTTGVVMIDFDTLCQSDPALDVGNFLAHVHLIRIQGLTDSADGGDAFLGAYLDSAKTDVQPRVRAYTKSALLRLACLYSFWPRWQHVARPLLEKLREL